MHPGTPCVFYDHFWEEGLLGASVRKLLKVRRTNGIHARSKVCPPSFPPPFPGQGLGLLS